MPLSRGYTYQVRSTTPPWNVGGLCTCGRFVSSCRVLHEVARTRARAQQDGSPRAVGPLTLIRTHIEGFEGLDGRLDTPGGISVWGGTNKSTN